MKVLVANLGSTSFKYRLFDFDGAEERMLARGSVERIGGPSAVVRTQVRDASREQSRAISDHGEAMQICLEALSDRADGVLASVEDVAAIGFKAVHSRDHHGVHRVDEAVLAGMEAWSEVAPAHNPPYVKAMRTLAARFPQLPMVAAFETDFHATIPEANRRYAIPEDWADRLGVRRWGFHGASHRFIATRARELLAGDDLKVISCHLGGSSSLCAIDAGRSVACSLGMSPQSGLPHNNRVGEFDVFALPVILRETGQPLEQVLEVLSTRSGLEGLCGMRDLRDIEAAASSGDERAARALGVFVSSIRHYVGAYLVELGGADAIVFTGGIGENSARVRWLALRGLEWFGIVLDAERNQTARGECLISSADSRVAVWTVPTNEELIVARQTRDLLLGAAHAAGSSGPSIER